MVFENINISFFQGIGNWFSDIMIKIIQFLASLGINLTEAQGKVVSLLVISIIGYLSIKIVGKPLRYFIVILSILLAVSILSTFFA